MRVLIVGGCGFIGSHLVEHFQGKAEVRVLDNLRTGRSSNLAGFDFELLEESILDRAIVRRAVKGVDLVFHLAAMVSVSESMAKPDECVALNITGFINVLEEAAAAGVHKLCFSSSAAVYGDNPIVPKVETMMPEPCSPYAITKLAGEHFAALINSTGRLEVACLRYFNVFGPRQDPGGSYAAVVPILVRHALANEPLTILGDGEQERDFVGVRDVVSANLFAANKVGLAGVYNVGYGAGTTINELARIIVAEADSRSVIRHEAPRAGDVRHSVANVDKLRAAGFTPGDTLRASLAETVRYYRQGLR